MDTGKSQRHLLQQVVLRMISHLREEFEQEECFRWSQLFPDPENLYQRGPNDDFLDQKALLANTLYRINFLQFRPGRAA